MVDREEDFSGENGSVRDLEYGENTTSAPAFVRQESTAQTWNYRCFPKCNNLAQYK